MPPAPKTTFLALFAAESDAPLPSGDAAISAALDAYGAEYAKGSSMRLNDLHEETLAGLSWLHLNHEDVASALRRITEPHQQLLATALGLDYAAQSAKPQWPTILGSATAEKPGVQSSAELEDDDVDEVDLASDGEDDPWSAHQLPPRKKPAKGGKSGAGTKQPATSPSPPSEDASGAGSAEQDGHGLPPMPDTYCDSADVTARANKLCRLPWIGSTLLANCRSSSTVVSSTSMAT